MTNSSNNLVPNKAAICIKEMAAAVGLSRQRFMQLVKSGVFPAPLRDEATGRPYYTDEMQAVCLDVRRRNCGVNGKVVMFYPRRSASPDRTNRPRPVKAKQPSRATSDCHADIVAGLHGLGLTSATSAQVSCYVRQLSRSSWLSGLRPTVVPQFIQ
jgi:hypothetical protein